MFTTENAVVFSTVQDCFRVVPWQGSVAGVLLYVYVSAAKVNLLHV